MVMAGGNKNQGSRLIPFPYLPGSVHTGHAIHVLVNENQIIYLGPESANKPGPAFKLIQFRYFPFIILTDIAHQIFFYLLPAHH